MMLATLNQIAATKAEIPLAQHAIPLVSNADLAKAVQSAQTSKIMESTQQASLQTNTGLVGVSSHVNSSSGESRSTPSGGEKESTKVVAVYRDEPEPMTDT